MTSSAYRTASVRDGDSWKHSHSIATIRTAVVVWRTNFQQYGEVCQGGFSVDGSVVLKDDKFTVWVENNVAIRVNSREG